MNGCVQVELGCPDWTIFRAVQTIIQSTNLGSKVRRKEML
jgi:hypothetical protein